MSPLALVIPVRNGGSIEVQLSLGLWLGALGYQLSLARRGQSIGKQLRGLRVVRSDGSTASVWRIVFWRNALLLPAQLTLVDAAFILRSDQRCLHDLVADTKVVTVSRRR